MTNARDEAGFIARMLASGGDSRITVRAGGNTNIYGASPFPRETLAYSASTANDISVDAFAHLRQLVASWPAGALLSPLAYAGHLDRLRARIRAAYGLPDDIGIVFAPSGTDLEYVALSLVRSRAGRPVTNLLLGADEVGSGCILSAAGRLFAPETALGAACVKGEAVGGLEDTRIAALPVRDGQGAAVDPDMIEGALDRAVEAAAAEGRHLLAHVVHGSKTGLILPTLAALDRLRLRHGDRVSFVVDACQARISGARIRDYLARDAIVLLTGSKFMGGPPFSGIALIPRHFAAERPLAAGLAALCRRAEWPSDWSGLDHLAVEPNPGLLLRLEAAVFELERFSALSAARCEAVISRFDAACTQLTNAIGARRVRGEIASSLLESATLATLDLTTLPGTPDLAAAQCWHRALAARGIRLGQPVKCVRLSDGRWGGTLRISLSMPRIVSLAALDGDAIAVRLAGDMARIEQVLRAATRPISASGQRKIS